MNKLPFGGAIGVFVDPRTRREVKLRCTGVAMCTVALDDALRTRARAALIATAASEIRRALAAGHGLLGVDAVVGPGFAAAASAAVGFPIDSASFAIGMSDEDGEALAAADVAAARAAPAVAAGPRPCPSCGAPAAGKFCASCGASMNAPPAPAAAPAAPAAPPAPRDLAPPNTPFLCAGVFEAIGAGSRVTVPPNHCFVGFAQQPKQYVLTLNLPAGVHVLPQGCDKGMFVNLQGSPFVARGHVDRLGAVEFHGTMYIDDPAKAMWSNGNVESADEGVLPIVLARSADAVIASVANEQQLCAAVTQAYPRDENALQGTTVRLSAIRQV